MNQKIEELTNQIETGVKALFESDKYKEYLKVMSKFTNYSVNNTILIFSQKPDAQLVAGYTAWKNNFHRQVQSGSKAIRIIQPSPYKKTVIEYVTDENGQKIMDKNGNPIGEKREKIMQGYKVGYVFDVSDTEGTPLPSLITNLTEDINNYELFKSILEKIADIPVKYESIQSGANGFYSLSNNDIHIRDDLSQSQTIKTLIHEMAHSIIHNQKNGTDKEALRNIKEIEAESVAFIVCSYYGLDTSDYSFAYIGGYSKSEDLLEFKSALNVIRETADSLIKKIDDKLMQEHLQKYDKALAYKWPDAYLMVEPKADNNYVFTFLDRNGDITEQGNYVDDKPIGEVAENIMIAHNKDIKRAVLQDETFVKDKMCRAMSESYKMERQKKITQHIK